MNYLFLLNACILLCLGAYLHTSKRDRLSFLFLMLSLGVAAWNICVFLVEVMPEVINVDLVSRVQIFSSLIFGNGMFFFCASYPQGNRKEYLIVNLLLALIISCALLFTDFVTKASLVNGEVIYTDGFGFYIYGIYMAALGIGGVIFLLVNYRQYHDYRERIKYLLIGFGVFVVLVFVFNIVLPVLGEYRLLNVGRLSSILPAFFFAYAITKHDLMDINVIINRKTSWLFTMSVVVGSFIIVSNFVPENKLLQIISMSVLGLFWALYGTVMQNFLLTSARRKFIRSWYNTEDLISELSTLITPEKNREAIFTIIERVIDEAFQLEHCEVIFSVRTEQEKISHYICVEKTAARTKRSKLTSNPLLEADAREMPPSYYSDCEPDVQKYLDLKGYKSGQECVVIPFYSPEFLEGVMILGERSNQESYLERDMKFFIRLVNYISAILYRLTPFEKLENQYFENRQKLHEAEIQLIRAQKIESIVHATRQCHHEIRTPLNIIQLGIRRIKTLDDLRSYQDMAKEEISRALEIVEETLIITDVSKSSEDRVAEVDVNEVVQRCSRLIDKNRFDLTINQGDIPEISAVFSDIQVVITNLIHNAVEVMEDGGEIIITTQVSGNSVVLEVEDNGPGIPEELRSKVWEPYFSGHETDVGNSNAGRGWGLTIVNRIVTEHRGTARFESELGRGTKFIVSLPVGAK